MDHPWTFQLHKPPLGPPDIGAKRSAKCMNHGVSLLYKWDDPSRHKQRVSFGSKLLVSKDWTNTWPMFAVFPPRIKLGITITRTPPSLSIYTFIAPSFRWQFPMKSNRKNLTFKCWLQITEDHLPKLFFCGVAFLFKISTHFCWLVSFPISGAWRAIKSGSTRAMMLPMALVLKQDPWSCRSQWSHWWLETWVFRWLF